MTGTHRTIALILIAALGVLAGIGVSGATGTLEAGFASRTITPVGPSPAGWGFWVNPTTQLWSEPFADTDGDGCFDKGEPFTDDLRNSIIDPDSAGQWDGVWTNAGFGGKCALGVLDDTWARAVVMSDGSETVAMVSLDAVGFFNEEIKRAQAEFAASYPWADLDAFIVSSTHTHEAPDTMGLWGEEGDVVGDVPKDGKFPLYQAYIRSRIVEAVAAAYLAMEPATVTFAHADHAIGIRDSRPPQVIDDDLWAARFRRGDGTTIGTIVNWSNHPESLGSNNSFISSDFPHGARTRLEEHYGGTAIYFSGSVGGLMTPLGVDVPGFGTAPTYSRMLEIGRLIAEAAIAPLDAATPVADPDVAVQHREFFIPIDHQGLRALNAIGVFDKPTFTAGVPSGSAGQDAKTEMYAVTVGPAVFVTVPGELFPELAHGPLGRLDCPAAHTGRPHEPIIRDQFTTAVYKFILGLGQDELGYIVPGYDFWLTGVTPDAEGVAADGPDEGDLLDDGPTPLVTVGIDEAEDPCGEDHYEETVSASSVMAPIVTCTAAELAGHDPWGDLLTDPPAGYEACSHENTHVGPMGVHPEALGP